MPDTEEKVLTPIEETACETIRKAFERNREYWREDHKRQHRLFDMIMSAPIPEKPQIKNRSNVRTGVSWMIHQLIFSILRNSLLTLQKNVRLEPTKTRKLILWLEEMQAYLDRLINDQTWPVHNNLRNALFDLVSHGTGVLRPYYRDDLKSVWDGENEMQVLDYSGPDMPYIASWDTYPTAGATSVEECHEIIFYEYYYPHELREFERAGKMRNVDELLKNYKEPSWLSKSESDNKEPREQHDEKSLRTDTSGRIGVLVYWGLFPLYENEEYIGPDGEDLSKKEVECLMIKSVDRDLLLYFERNPYYHQKKESIFAKYFNIPGLFWGESIFGILQKMLLHQEDWFNIIQDSANWEVYRDRVMSDAIPPEQRKQKGVGRDYVVDAATYEKMGGKVMHYLERGNAVLPDTYAQLENIDRIIQQVGGIMDFLRATASKVPKTATEIEELAASLNVRFEQTAMEVGGSLLIPAISWAVSLLSSDFANDEFIGEQMGVEVFGKYLNPFKQFSPRLPNPAYRIKLEGSLRAVQNIALQNQLRNLIEQAKDIPPGPDENGEVVTINRLQMFLDELKLSKLPETDRYKLPWVPPIAPEGPGPEPVETGTREANVSGQ
jgi:hypothetical protein